MKILIYYGGYSFVGFTLGLIFPNAPITETWLIVISWSVLWIGICGKYIK